MAKIYEEFEDEFAEKLELKEPRLYKVKLLNDDFTSMDFVIMILMELFHHDSNKAAAIMYKIHEEGSAVCGVFTYEIAETKVAQVHERAKKYNYPLRATMEEE